MKSKQTIALLGALALAAQTVFAVSTSDTKADKLFTDDIVAKGKGVEVKRSELDELFINARAAIASRGGNDVDDSQRDLMQAQLLERLIVTKLLVSRSTPADKTAAADATQKYIADIRKQAGEEAFQKQLLLAKLASVDDLEKKLSEEQLPKIVLDRELKPQVKVTDADVKKFYDDNPSRFEQPEMVKVAHLLIATRDTDGNELPQAKKDDKRKLADGLLKRAKAGEDFIKIGKSLTDEPARDNGAEITFPRGSQGIPPELELAAFGLKAPGDISAVVTTGFGYHVVKLTAKLPAKTILFGEVATKIKDGLTAQAEEKLIPAYVEKLEKDANVEILDAKLKEAKKKALEMSAASGKS